ncbi:MAG: cytochrome c3 family protein [Deltaproteobacteria bacterium]|nr:cytochrome c3 family protein [Deltaproteobacteria bacterium]
MSRFFRPVRNLWPVLLALVLGVVASASLATIRIKVEGGETVELMAERLYGDIRKAAVIRAANKVNDGEQPADGAFIKIPGVTVHTVASGETMQKVADRFLSADGGAALLAEANGLAPNAALKPGQVLSVFAEVEVRTNNRSAEDIANIYLGDANLGARIRRYNGVADGGKLGGKTYVPLVGLDPRGGVQPPVAVVTPPVAVVTPPVAVVTPPVAVVTPPVYTPPVVTPPVYTPPAVTPPAIVSAPPTMMPGAEGMPVTSKLATLSGFSHALHTPLTVAGQPIACLTCHEHADPNGFGNKPPSQQNCLICHRQSEVMPPALRKGQIKRLPLPMNHKLHVGQNQIDCTVCHIQEPDRPLGIITQGHEACSVCHTQGSIPPYVAGDPSGLSCTVCHGTVEEEPLSPERSRYLRNHMIRPFGRVGDVFFTHMTHATFGPGGVPGGQGPNIDCRACHADAYEAETKEAISKVKMQGCLECHRQANAVGLQPPERCADCHLHHRQGHMPQNEMIMTAKPLDHTAFFRRHHETAARENAPMCASCHVGSDPNDGSRCDTCHATMKPRDHTAGFRDRVHGRTAQLDPARCTTCHRAERCESCHREIPKSHFPLNVWVEKGLHGSRGRLELGACLTCHKFEQTCSRCHTAVQK